LQRYFISTGQLNDYKLDNVAASPFMAYWIGFSRASASSPWTSVDGSITLQPAQLNLFSSPYARWLPEWFANGMDANAGNGCLMAAGKQGSKRFLSWLAKCMLAANCSNS
jgi:hypothetical protein